VTVESVRPLRLSTRYLNARLEVIDAAIAEEEVAITMMEISIFVNALLVAGATLPSSMAEVLGEERIVRLRVRADAPTREDLDRMLFTLKAAFADPDFLTDCGERAFAIKPRLRSV
jgi:hypothetical protein